MYSKILIYRTQIYQTQIYRDPVLPGLSPVVMFFYNTFKLNLLKYTAHHD